MKILAPVGNFESLKVAVYYGADEVYLGVNNFNARNNISGFDLGNLKEVVDFAHVYGVKVNLAINILFKNSEMQEALDIVVEAYNWGVDSFIIQDLGLISLINKYYPEIEIHASTQMGLHNFEGIKWLERFGFKRIVLARETPLFEIERIHNRSDVELEYFVHGALCVSFSGNCYLSSYMCDASGNRGRCKQLCRLPYTLLKDGKIVKNGYLLSAKDIAMQTSLKDLNKAGINVLKIEGRARRPYYVATAIKEYKNLIDGKKINKDNLNLGFNREFTEGYFVGNGSIISKYNNHIGVEIGKVQKVNRGKKFNEVIISSDRTLSPKSTFKMFDGYNEMTTLTAFDLQQISKDRYRITTTQKVLEGWTVRLISDFQKEEEMSSFVKKRLIKANIYAKENEKIKVILNFDDQKIECEGCICQPALKQPLSINTIQENFKKHEIFELDFEDMVIGNVFMSKAELNEFRRNVFDKIYIHITEKYRHSLEKIKISNNYKIKKFEDFQIVENINDKFESGNIIYFPEEYSLTNIVEFTNKCKKLGKKPYLDTPNFALTKDIELLQNIIEKTKISIIANNYYALNFDTEIVIGAGLNVYNNYTAEIYDLPIITAESDISTKLKFPVMTLRHCPMKNHLNANCDKCPYSSGYKYIMQNGKELTLKRKKLSTCTFYLHSK